MKAIVARYCGSSRFKGKSMDLSLAGQDTLIKIITARLGEVNIDAVSKILSSNCCENYFSVLTKFSHGKRLNGNFTDTWRVQQAVAAGMIGNHMFVSNSMDFLVLKRMKFNLKILQETSKGKFTRRTTTLQTNKRKGES